jgi:hypothetical protein
VESSRSRIVRRNSSMRQTSFSCWASGGEATSPAGPPCVVPIFSHFQRVFSAIAAARRRSPELSAAPAWQS